MPLWPDSVVIESIKAVFGLGLLASGWYFGQRIIAQWDLRKKQQELDVSTAVQFQQLYGELKEVGRLWRESRKPGAAAYTPADGFRWSVLARATNAESKYETVVMKLAAERALDKTQRFTLGLFRQACQQLRQSIRSNEEVSWSGFGPAYRLFNDLAAEVTCLIGEARPDEALAPAVACENLEQIANVRGADWLAATVAYEQLYPGTAGDANAVASLGALSAHEKLALPRAVPPASKASGSPVPK
jgi:hypothetical protein